MATFSMSYRSSADLTETFPTDASATSGGTTATAFNTTSTMNATSTPAISEGGYCTKAMSAGAATIDLTATVTSRSRTMDFTGLKIRVFRAKNPSTNTGNITIAKGASNGYTGFGSAFSITLKPGQEHLFYDAGNGVAVSASVKTLDISGTGSESLQFTVTGGA